MSQYMGMVSLTRQMARTFSVFNWGSGTVEDWQARCIESQHLSELRRAQGARAHRRRSEQLRMLLTLLLAFVVVVVLAILAMEVT